MQHDVSVESSSLLLRGIGAWFVCLPWWLIDGLGVVLLTEQPAGCFVPLQKLRARLCMYV